MKKSKIYTKTGDGGETGLVSGNRISKSDSRIDLYGELDELNSRIGFSAALLGNEIEFTATRNFLQEVQSVIFDLGSNLACELEHRQKYNLPQIPEQFIRDIELEIDRLDGQLPALQSFILPGGSLAGASLHLGRTSARTVERRLIGYFQNSKEVLPANSMEFLNRLSDYLFILARFVNQHLKSGEITWKPRP
ncbi:MAG TPA: cob(I)yrinic acid a,c-diamide adenosyltransferase [Bacteriovoracaceae bacterium]|nr:cob(I)yrinic acid a,c-diamide adenosyltransferase [Bacteriovoracaceae bacterium]